MEEEEEEGGVEAPVPPPEDSPEEDPPEGLSEEDPLDSEAAPAAVGAGEGAVSFLSFGSFFPSVGLSPGAASPVGLSLSE